MNSRAVFLVLCLCFPMWSLAQSWNRPSGGDLNPGPYSGIVLEFGYYNEDLVVCGGFDSIGNVEACVSAKFDGNFWSGFTGCVGGVCVAEYDGDLYFGGGGINLAGIPEADLIVRWNGSAWEAISTFLTSGPISQTPYDMKVYKGELYLIGNLANFYLSPDLYISRWNGSQMLGVGGGLDGGTTMGRVLEVYDDLLIAGGTFGYAGGVYSPCVAAWDGNTWHALGNALNGSVVSMVSDTVNNVLYVGGAFTWAGNGPVSYLAKWDGDNWYDVGGGANDAPYGLCMYKSQLYVAGGFTTIGGQPIEYLARFNGQSWDSLNAPPDNGLTELTVFQDELYVGGGFSTIGDSTIQSLARWHYPEDSACKDLMVAIAPFPDTLYTSQLPYKFRSHSYSNNYCAWSFSDGHTANTGHAVHDFNMTPGIYTVTLEAGCTTDTLTAQQQVVIVSDVGIEEQAPFNVHIYPNPNQGQVHVRFKNVQRQVQGDISFIDMQGNALLRYAYDTAEGEKTLPVHSLARGSYLMQFSTGKGEVIHVQKIEVQ